MSSAHRPTWTPAMGKDARMNTKQYSSRDIAGHTKLKYRQPGQNNKDDIDRRDLRLELERAERESEDKRRRMAGLLPLKHKEQKDEEAGKTTKLIEEGEESSTTAKRRKILEEALLADKDDSGSDDDDDSNDGRNPSHRNGKSKATSVPLSSNSAVEKGKTNGGNDDVETDEESEDGDDDSDDDESETAELLRELEKIKRERAEEKERQERESAANSVMNKEAQAAIGNPLLNLKAALGNASPTNSISTSTTTSFSVKRRWDDDVIFKNQARDVNEKPKKAFVNDLLRTEFHRRFLKKFIA